MSFFTTSRLILRNWQTEDLQPFAQLNQDPRVREFYPNLLSFGESKELMEKIIKNIQKDGFGLYACALKETNTFIGYVGLNIPDFKAHFSPCVEIGWRLAYAYWGKGYATEAAKAAIQIGFQELNLSEIVAFAVRNNQRSIRVMVKLGMSHDKQDDFQHPSLPKDHPLSWHVLYRLKKQDTRLNP